ncbi:MAG: acyl-CoA dehydratase activase, partial [Planctomycetota bacterium]
MGNQKMYLGIDVGSVSVKVVLISDAVNNSSGFTLAHIIERHYVRSHGQSVETVLAILRDLAARSASGGLREISLVATTGAGGKLIAEHLNGVNGVNGFFVNEVLAQATATTSLYPEVKTIIEIGGEDSKLIQLAPIESRLSQDKSGLASDGGSKQVRVIDFATNSICAAGTGSFLDQQASRMGLNIEEFGPLALKSTRPPSIAGRCSVFAKTDMIHLQQVGTPLPDIIAGLCYAMARNFRSTVAKAKTLVKPIAFQGGVAANQGMVQAFINVLELNAEELVIPEDFALMGAIGAVLAALNQNIQTKPVPPSTGQVPSTDPLRLRRTDHRGAGQVDLIKALENYLQNRRMVFQSLDKLEGDDYPININPVPISGASSEKVEAYVGVDVGSISTNVVVIDKNKNVIARRYLMTASKPVEAVMKGLYEVGQEIGDRIIIKGCGSTGSGRYMTGEFFGADVIKNEISSHARGAVAIDPTIDTIFEIGGQDSKYISLSNGVVVDFTMNKVCAAGTGSFLEEQAEKLAVQLNGEFGERALKAPCPGCLGERCTVFMESQLNFYKQQGLEKDNLLGGLAYSIVTNYLNRVVEQRKIGNRIFFQGGVAFNRAVKAAFEKVVGKKVIVPPHHDILGAYGVAIIAMEESGQKQTRFKGFDLRHIKYETQSFECKHCANFCEIRRVNFDAAQPLFYGARCGRYDDQKTKKAKESSPIPRLFQEREEQVFKETEGGSNSCVIASEAKQSSGNEIASVVPLKQDAIAMTDSKRIGIPRILMAFELYPLWQTFFKELGYEVILSSPTNRSLVKKGVEHVVAEPCFPIKTAHGHMLDLLEKKIDYLFLPVMINMPKLSADFDRSYLCPYVQSLPFTSRSSVPFEKYPVKVLKPVFHMMEGPEAVARSLKETARQLGIKQNSRIESA